MIRRSKTVRKPPSALERALLEVFLSTPPRKQVTLGTLYNIGTVTNALKRVPRRELLPSQAQFTHHGDRVVDEILRKRTGRSLRKQHLIRTLGNLIEQGHVIMKVHGKKILVERLSQKHVAEEKKKSRLLKVGKKDIERGMEDALASQEIWRSSKKQPNS